VVAGTGVVLVGSGVVVAAATETVGVTVAVVDVAAAVAVALAVWDGDATDCAGPHAASMDTASPASRAFTVTSVTRFLRVRASTKRVSLLTSVERWPPLANLSWCGGRVTERHGSRRDDGRRESRQDEDQVNEEAPHGVILQRRLVSRVLLARSNVRVSSAL
jgi:hypothetical protein